ncbi:hypothetical protein BKA70DRAFT_1251959 [Coprinopsis sp. MPI-PUGE-AT-0042]|nr:hypothetical protein BKA70DRAFT_1251959 [Coprinopsis sp. MPI-PUGE-AT-0042]
MSFVEAHYHPFLFSTMALLGMAEVSVTAYLINSINEETWFPSERHRALLIALCFMASWTTLFATTYMLWFFDRAGHFLANIASSVAWLLATSIFWGLSSGLMHTARPGGSCAGKSITSTCRLSLTVEALGWAECGVCVIATLATCFWMYASRRISHKASGESATRLV